MASGGVIGTAHGGHIRLTAGDSVIDDACGSLYSCRKFYSNFPFMAFCDDNNINATS